jgi:hypothetical protein
MNSIWPSGDGTHGANGCVHHDGITGLETERAEIADQAVARMHHRDFPAVSSRRISSVSYAFLTRGPAPAT